MSSTDDHNHHPYNNNDVGEEHEEGGGGEEEEEEENVGQITGRLPTFLRNATLDDVVLCPVGEACSLDNSKRRGSIPKLSRLKSINNVSILEISSDQLRGWCSKMKIFDANGKSMRKATKIHMCQNIVYIKMEYDDAKAEGREPNYNRPSHERGSGDYYGDTTNNLQKGQSITLPTAAANRIRYANVLFGNIVKPLLLHRGAEIAAMNAPTSIADDDRHHRISDKYLHTAIANEYNTKRGNNALYDNNAFPDDTNLHLMRKHQPSQFQKMKHWQQSYDCFKDYVKDYEASVSRWKHSSSLQEEEEQYGDYDDNEEDNGDYDYDNEASRRLYHRRRLQQQQRNQVNFDDFTNGDPSVKYFHRYVLQNPGIWEILLGIVQQQQNHSDPNSTPSKNPTTMSPAKKKKKTSHDEDNNRATASPSFLEATIANAINEGIMVYSMIAFNNEVTRLRNRKRELFGIMIHDICQGDRQIAKERWWNYRQQRKQHDDQNTTNDDDNDNHSIDSQASLFEEMISCDTTIQTIKSTKEATAAAAAAAKSQQNGR